MFHVLAYQIYYRSNIDSYNSISSFTDCYDDLGGSFIVTLRISVDNYDQRVINTCS